MSGHPSPEQVLNDLASGQLDGLACYLRQSSGHIDPRIAQKLASIIDGSAEETGFRLKVDKHPDLARGNHGVERRQFQQIQEQLIIEFITDQVVFSRECYAEAIFAAASQFKMGQDTIKKIWSSRAQLREKMKVDYQKFRDWELDN